MTPEAVTWVSLISALGACVAVVKFWFDRGKAEAKAEAAQLSAAACHGKIELLQGSLSEFKVEVAREYATAKSLEISERQMAEAMQGIRSEMRGMNERLDKFLHAILQRDQA